MAFIDCHFYSEVIGIASSMHVILPQTNQEHTSDKFPTLYLLHGLSDDHTMWMRRTSIERYADKYQLAVVMPAVHRSFYTDMEKGYRYGTFIAEELPRLAQAFFPLSREREHNYIAGLSMGGYGALKMALSFPEKYSAAASLSGVTDLCALYEKYDTEEIRHIFGPLAELKGSKHDLFALAQTLATSQQVKPSLYQCCGTEDFLYDDNVRFRDYCQQIGVALTYEEESGVHDWLYWDKQIERVLEWLPLDEKS